MGAPTYLSQFVGREAELAEIGRLVRDSSTPLVTLTGPGGSGKTRLAEQAFVALSESFEDGATWVDLVALSDPASVPPAVAVALDVSAAPGQRP